MPQIPFASGPSVGLAPTPQIRAPQEAFGSPQPTNLAPLANLATQIFQEEKQKSDQVALLAANAQLSAAENKHLYDPDIGVLNAKGKDAFGAAQKATEGWQKDVGDIANTLTNDTQKARFAAAAQAHGSALNEQVARHVAAERTNYDLSTTNAFLANEQDAGIKGTPDRTDMSVANQRAAIIDFGKRNGWSDEQVQQHIAENVSKTRFGVFERLANGEQDIAAAQYLAAHRDDFVGQDLLQAEKLAEAGSTRGESQRHADAIVASATDLSDAISAVHTIDNAKVRDETEQRVRQAFTDKANDARQQASAAYQRAGQIVDDTKDVNKVPLSEWEALTVPEKKSLRDYAKELRNLGEGPGDPEKYMNLLNQAYFNPTAFAAANLLSVGGLNTTQKTHLLELRSTIGNRDQREDEANIERALTRAQADQRYYARKAEAAGIAGDEDAQHLFANQRDQADLDITNAQQALRTRKANVVSPSGGPTVPGAGGTAPVTPAPTLREREAQNPTPNPIGLTPIPKVKATPQMLDDVAKKGPGYAEYLRSMGVNVPLLVTPVAQASVAPAALNPAPPAVAAPLVVTPAPVSVPAPVSKPAAPVVHPVAAPTPVKSATKVSPPSTPVVPIPPNQPVPATPGTVYEKSGHQVIDTPRPDADGHVPTHRLDQPTNRRAGESWTSYEDRVLAAKGTTDSEATHSDLASLAPDVRTATQQLIDAAKSDGVRLTPKETLRTQERQEALFRQGRSTAGDPVTWTLTSDHSLGRAVDFSPSKSAVKWLAKNASKYGFTTLGDMDPGHVSIPKSENAAVIASGRAK